MADMGNIEYTVSVETGKAFRAADDFDQSLNRMEQSANKADRTFGKMNTTLTQVARSVAAIVSVGAVVNEFKKAVQVTADFNQTMSNLSSLTGLVGPQLDDLANKAKAIGSTTSLSATQAASAMQLIGSKAPELLASADGLTKVTEAAVVLAEAAGTDMTTAAVVLTSTMNQFNLVAEDSDRIINTLAAGAALGASSVSETAAALARAGTQANESNVSIEQFTGAVQALAKGEIAASDAGTALRNTLLILDNQMDRNLKPSVVGLDSALENLKKEQKAGLDMLKLFGRENITAANVLLNNIDVYKDVTQAVTDTNAAYEQQALRNDNLTTDVKNLGSAYEGLQLTIGSMVDGELRSFTQALTSMLLALGDTSDGTSKLETILNGLAIAGAATASVIAGRLATSIATYGYSQAGQIAATLKNNEAMKLAADAALRRSASEKLSADAILATARADFEAARGTASHTATRKALSAATDEAIAKTAAYNTAVKASNSIATGATVAVNGLKSAMSFLGGPVGVIMLAVTAFYAFSGGTKQAKTDLTSLMGPLDEAIDKFNELGRAAKEGLLAAMRIEIQEAGKTLKDTAAEARFLRSRLGEVSRAGDDFDALVSASEKVEAAVKGMIDGVPQDFDALSESINNNTSISQAAKDVLNTYIASIVETQGEARQLQQRHDELKGSISATGDAARSTKGDIDGLNDSLSEGSIYAKQYGDRLSEALANAKDSSHLGRLNRDIVSNAEKWSEASDEYVAAAFANAIALDKLEAAKSRSTKSSSTATTAQREYNAEVEKERRAIEQNIETFNLLNEEIYQFTLTADQLIERQAELSLNEYATDEQIQGVKNLTAALAEMREQQKLEQEAKELTGQADQEKYELELERYQEMLNRKLISDMEYEEAKAQLEQENDERIRAMEEERFRRQSAINDAFIGALNNMGDVAANSMMGFITGTRSAEGAIKDLGRSIAAEFLGNLVKIGVQMAINAAKDKLFSGAAATTAASTGAAIAASMAPAAALTSLAMAGTNAAPAQAGMISTAGLAQALAFGGGRQYGGAVDADKVYRVNEGGRPEIFSGADGHQYMMPNQRGEVVSNKDASKGGGGVTVIVNESPNARASVEQSQGDDGDTIISITVQDITGGGPIRDAIGSTFGLEAQGT